MKDNETYGTPVQITKENTPVTGITRFQLPGTIFLVTINDNSCYVYTVSGGEGLSRKSKDKKMIEFKFDEDKNLNASDFKVCNTQIAQNGRFFAIGLVSDTKSLFGIY